MCAETCSRMCVHVCRNMFMCVCMCSGAYSYVYVQQHVHVCGCLWSLTAARPGCCSLGTTHSDFETETGLKLTNEAQSISITPNKTLQIMELVNSSEALKERLSGFKASLTHRQEKSSFPCLHVASHQRSDSLCLLGRFYDIFMTYRYTSAFKTVIRGGWHSPACRSRKEMSCCHHCP